MTTTHTIYFHSSLSLSLPYNIIYCYFHLQATYGLFSDDGVLKLPYCIAISGFVCALFAIGIPYLSALRIWLGFSTLFSLMYIVIAVVLSSRDGITAPARDYSIPKSSQSTRVFTTIGSIADLVFAYNTGMLPEIQVSIFFFWITFSVIVALLFVTYYYRQPSGLLW